MNYATIFDYAGHFLRSCVEFLGGPLGVVVLGLAVALIIVYLFEDLRR